MASVSYGLNRRADQSPDRIVIGTLAVSANEVELRWDNAASPALTKLEIIKILEAFVRRLEDGRFNDNTTV